MPNILITNYCNRNCPYCFAKKQVELGTTISDEEMSFDNISKVLEYYNADFENVSLLGGEPSLHSDFGRIVKEIVQRGYGVTVFSNGCTPYLREARDGVPEHLINVVLNLNEIETYSEQELSEIHANCEAFGDKLQFSCNVYKPEFQWDHFVALFKKYSLGSRIRISLAQPIQGKDNEYLLDSDVSRACRKIIEMAEDIAVDGMSLGFDCGFRICMFTREELGILIECNARLLFVCSPIIDIGPELDIWRCFPFAESNRVHLDDFDSFPQISEYYKDQLDSKRSQYHGYGCASCEHFKAETCSGGCLSRILGSEEV